MNYMNAALASVTITFITSSTSLPRPVAKKPTNLQSYYFDANKKLSRGDIKPGTRVLIQSQLTTTANWTTTIQAGAPGFCLNAIRFEQEAEDLSDGIADGAYSLQEAINAVWAEYSRREQFDLPAHGSSFTPDIEGASAIIIERSPSN